MGGGQGINMTTDVRPEARQLAAVVVTLLKRCLTNIQKTYGSRTVPRAVKTGVVANRGLRAHVGNNTGLSKTKEGAWIFDTLAK